MKTVRPPLGVMPWYLWIEEWPDHTPDLKSLLVRYMAVRAAISRYRKAGKTPRPEWLAETDGGSSAS